MKLVYLNMSAADREDMAMDRFAKVMNNVELLRYLIPLRPTSMRECLRLSDELLQADNHGSRTPRLAAVAGEETTLLECMKALQQKVLQQGQTLKQMQQQQQAAEKRMLPVWRSPLQEGLSTTQQGFQASSSTDSSPNSSTRTHQYSGCC